MIKGRIMLGRDPHIARVHERGNVVKAGQLRSVVLGDFDRPRAASTAPKKSAVPSHRSWKTQAAIYEFERAIIAFAQRAYPWVARCALFVVFFWFGFVKLLGLSEATGLAKALTAKTVGSAHFELLFNVLAVLECVIGVLCLIPRAVRLVIALLIFHMAMVCSPLILVPEMTWETVLVPTMDGQYIIKNVLVIAAAFGLAAHAAPRKKARADSPPPLDIDRWDRHVERLTSPQVALKQAAAASSLSAWSESGIVADPGW